MGTFRSALQITVALMILGVGVWKVGDMFLSSEAVELTGRAPQAVPASLAHRIPGQSGLYWFGLKVRNGSDESVRGTLHLEAKPSFGATIDASERVLTLPPRDTTIAVPVSFVDMPPSRRFFWEYEFVRDPGEDTDTLTQDLKTDPIEILDSTILPFDITTLDGTRVPTDVILAMLSTWTLPDDFRGPTIHLADSIAAELDEGGIVGVERRTEFMRRSVRDLFDSGRLRVGPVRHLFPMSGRQRIATPDSILGSGPASVTPIEAALLLAALARQDDRVANVRLFVLPATADSDAEVALAWYVDGEPWDAIGVGVLGRVEFNANLADATGRIARLLQERPDVRAALDGNGIFVEESEPVPLVAMDLMQTEAHYDILPRPRPPGAVSAEADPGSGDG